jgi:hypothetical protein
MVKAQKMHEIFPNGCSSKQLDKLRMSWFEKYGNPFLGNGDWSEVKLLESMYYALGMFSSCFAYGGVNGFFTEHGCMYKETYYQHYLNDYLEKGGTKEDFDKMLDIQKEHYKKCSVKYAGTDFEGCSYNAIIEEDEKTA